MNKKNHISVLAGIVTYNPDITRLLENVEAVYNQVDLLLIVDNGSKNVLDIKKNLDSFNVVYIINKKNLGIAKALSQIMDFAISNDYDWVLSLDQDSVCFPDLVKTYLRFVRLPKVATMTCKIEDRNYDRNEDPVEGEFEYLNRCITSGSFMNTEAYSHSDGYSVDFFIDRVDDDICYNLTKHGYKHIRVNYTGLLHEMGFGQEKKFLWHTARADNYSPVRRYYIFRNEVIIRAKYPELIKKEWLQSGRPMWINFVLLSLKVLLYEDDKKHKILSQWKGWKDGRKLSKQIRS